MEIKLSWRYLYFALLCTSLYRGVAGGLAGGKQYSEEEHDEGDQENTVEHVIERKLEPLQKIIFELQDSITTKMETITDLEYGLNRKIKEITENILLEQTTNITKKITDKIYTAFKQWGVLESTEKINHRLVVIENDLQNSIITKLETVIGLEHDLKREIKDITENVLLEHTRTITKQIGDKINSASKDKQIFDSTDKIMHRLVAMESNLQNSIDTKLEKMEIEISESRDKINLFTSNIEKLTNRNSSTCKENNNNLQSSIIKRLDTLENNRNQEIKDFADKINILTSNIKQNIDKTDSTCKEKTSLEPLLNIIINKLAAIDNDTNISITENLKVLEINRNREIKDLIVDTIRSLTTNTQLLTEKTDSTHTGKDILESIEKTNTRLVVLENITNFEEHNIRNLLNIGENIQTSVTKLNQELDYFKSNVTESRECDIKQTSQESANKMITEQIINITKQVTDNLISISKEKVVLDAIENINKKLVVLEKIPTLERQIKTLNNISETIQTSIPEVLNNNYYRATSSCSIAVPSSVRVNNNVWKYDQTPEVDDLDKFVVKQTGCTYRALKNQERFIDSSFSDGSVFLWRGAVRASEQAALELSDGELDLFMFIGDHDGTAERLMVTKTFAPKPWREIQRRSTPGIISTDHYVPFYVRIQAGTLTFGRECDAEPLYTQQVTVNKLRIQLYPFSHYGGKYLSCSSYVAGLLSPGII